MQSRPRQGNTETAPRRSTIRGGDSYITPLEIPLYAESRPGRVSSGYGTDVPTDKRVTSAGRRCVLVSRTYHSPQLAH